MVHCLHSTNHKRADTANFGHALVLAAERRWEARAEELEAYAPVHSAKKVRWSAWILAEVENSRKFAADTQALLAMAAEICGKAMGTKARKLRAALL